MTDAAPSRNPLHVPGVMRCARCDLALTRTNLYCGDGTAGPGTNETEPCPNGCGPLWPMTWEQQARRAIETLELALGTEKKLLEVLKLAYGHLWHVNSEPLAPVPMRSYEEATISARSTIAGALTKDERGDGIGLVRALLYGQEPLGPEFEAVWDANTKELYQP